MGQRVGGRALTQGAAALADIDNGREPRVPLSLGARQSLEGREGNR